jgi:hypothetical protein
MPDSAGRLTSEEKQRAAIWINQKAQGNRVTCFVCSHSDWVIGDHLVSPPVFLGSGFDIFGSTAYPLVQLICRVCGHTVAFSATMMGLTAPKVAPPPVPRPPLGPPPRHGLLGDVAPPLTPPWPPGLGQRPKKP